MKLTTHVRTDILMTFLIPRIKLKAPIRQKRSDLVAVNNFLTHREQPNARHQPLLYSIIMRSALKGHRLLVGR